MTAIVVATAVGAAYVGGTFYAFSTFVMKAMAALSPSAGAAAMQEINRKALTPLYMVGLFGTAAGSLGIGVQAVADWSTPRSVYLVAGAASYLVGVFVLTAVYHVPRNNRLDTVDPTSPEGHAYWAKYQSEWTRWNHLRATAGLAGAALLVAATRIG